MHDRAKNETGESYGTTFIMILDLIDYKQNKFPTS